MSRELTAAQKTRLTEILGYDPPTEVYDPGFADAYQKVVDADPELALAWQESLQEGVDEAPKVKLPVESAAGRARRTASFRGFIGKISSRKVEEEDTPTPTMPDQRKLTVSVFIVFFLIAGALLIGGFLLSPTTTANTPRPEPTATPTVNEPNPEPPTPPVVELPDAPEPSTPPPAPAPIATPPVVTPPPVVTNTSLDAPSPPPAVAAPAPATGGVVYQQAAQPTLATYRANTPAPTETLVYTASATTGSVITPASSHSAAPAPAGSSPVIFTENAPGREVLVNTRDDIRQNATFAHASEYQPAPSGTLIFDRSEQEEVALVSPRPDTPQSGTPTTPAPIAATQPPATNSPTALVGALTSAAAPTNPTGPALNTATPRTDTPQNENTPTPQQSQNPVALRKPDGTSFQLAERIPAILVTSATILDGIPAPVIAETRGEWCNATNCPTYSFVGTARMLGGNRVIINFNRVVTPDGVHPIEAIALGADYTTSIPATIRDETPTIAPDLVRASLNGVAAYADRMATATRTTIDSNGNMVQEDILPDLTSLIAGNAARALGLPQSATTVVRLAELEPGTPVIVTVGLTY